MMRDKRPTIRKFEIKLSIPPKLVLCNMYKQATQLTLMEGLVDIALGKLRVSDNIGCTLLQSDYNSVHPICYSQQTDLKEDYSQNEFIMYIETHLVGMTSIFGFMNYW